jgi:L-alanine-DL-glutamate epimerase-like enolase superfamily enzyme
MSDAPRPEDHIRTYSLPSDLKITDLRTATVGWQGWRFTLIRIDTSQGLSGYGEVRDGASKTYALMLKSRLLGENPCDVDRLFRKIKQFGHHARQGGGVCAVEMALMDLAGKAYGVPAYMLCGGKFRAHIRMYCDTPNEPTGEAMGHKLKARAVNVIHPDLATSGGILETKKIGDLAQEHGISMALHMAGTPVSTLASVHCAAATENFIALEHHFTDVPFWNDFIDGLPKPIIQDGYIAVPDAPGLGFTLNEEAVKEHLVPDDRGFFEPTPQWDAERSWDRLWS